ncbi:S49 family peptidase [Acidisphaera sp. L21]|uniref:S49 family peptidase n=1 Tax=Acidisphaera sp. L21 TaxID=1641851 RepID=UPI00131AFBC6|nr:S49 family peptidase [Acidisphaera sp. L21]
MNLFPWRRPRIPVVELHGLIAGREGALNIRSAGPLVERAFASVKKGGILILDIDSPGGSPVQSELIAGLVRRRAEKKQARVYAVIGEAGASGGYWLACAADEIHASAMSIVGSIGVVGGGFGFDQLIQRYGVERRLYTAGQNKARLDPFRPEQPEDVAFVQALMSDIHARFKAWVQERRGSRLSADPAVFDGSYCLGARGQELGLVDGLTSVDELVRRLAGERARVRRFRVRRRFSLARLPRMMMEAALTLAEERRLEFR